MSEKELDKFRAKVAKSGLNQQNYIVKSVLEIPIIETAAIREIIPQLKRVGNNLNQLVKEFHFGKFCDRDAILDNQKELNNIWQSLKQFLHTHR